MRFLKLGSILGAIHLILAVGLFVLFGIGLEGTSYGSMCLWALLEPLVSFLRFVEISPAAQLALVPVNSACWGFGLALLADTLNRMRRRG
jgi:hypothetical protein